MSIFRPFIQREPWAAALVSLALGPPFGMFYINRGRMGLVYTALLILLVCLPFVAFHYGYSDQSTVDAIESGFWVFAVLSAFHVFMAARRFDQARPLGWFARWYGPIVIMGTVLLSLLTFKQFAYENFNVPSISMDPALPYRSYFLASKSAYGYGVPFTNIRFFKKSPERGDVVLYYFDSGSGVITMVKRVVGIPGDTVQLQDGFVYLNGQALVRDKILNPYKPRQDIYDNSHESDRRYALFTETLPNGRSYRIVEEADTDNTLDTTELFKVPAGHYFLMGDNRDNSQDSRVSVVGFIAEDQIFAKAAFIYWDESVQKFLYAPVE